MRSRSHSSVKNKLRWKEIGLGNRRRTLLQRVQHHFHRLVAICMDMELQPSLSAFLMPLRAPFW